MRDLKFRAWSESLKLMQEPFDLKSHGGMLGDNGEIHRENYIVMQYTGLKDKNGVEIYEGDIVETAHQKYFTQNGDTKFYPNGTPPRLVEWIVGSHHNGWNIYDGARSEYEVIGNVYENKELLNEK